MLGRYAYEVQQAREGRAIGSMKEVGEEGQRYKERLWEIMVSLSCRSPVLSPFLSSRLTEFVDWFIVSRWR